MTTPKPLQLSLGFSTSSAPDSRASLTQQRAIVRTNFQTKVWKPLVTDLVAEGRVVVLLTQYHCRHTWITLALAAGMSVQDVSYLARVSVKVIYEHYVGRNRTIEIPEF